MASTLVIAGGMAGCGKKAEDQPAQPAPNPSPTKTKAPTPTPTAAADPWPLTGLPGPPQDRPALAIKVENSPPARPQAGLELADMVWEEVVEGGISRYVAVFHSQIPEVVGPIRSVRPMDGPIAGGVGGLLVFSGGQTRFINKATDAGLQVLGHDQGASGYYREPSRSGEHSLFGHPQKFLDQANEEHINSPKPEFEFAQDAAGSFASAKGQVVSSVQFHLSGAARPLWTWDQNNGRWLRSEGTAEAKAASGDRLSAVNVVALKVSVSWAGGRDAAGSAIPEMMVVGSGTGLVAANGKAVQVNWSKASANEPVVLSDAEGKSVKLAPGNTWVELVPTGDGSWTVG